MKPMNESARLTQSKTSPRREEAILALATRTRKITGAESYKWGGNQIKRFAKNELQDACCEC